MKNLLHRIINLFIYQNEWNILNEEIKGKKEKKIEPYLQLYFHNKTIN